MAPKVRGKRIVVPGGDKAATLHPDRVAVPHLSNVYDGPEGNHISWNVITAERVFPVLRGGWVSMANHYSCTIFDNQYAKDKLDDSGWLHLLECPRLSRNSKELVFSLIKRWWDLTHTFQLPGLEIGFTPLDFTFLIGISCGVGNTFLPFDKTRTGSWLDIRTRYFAALPVVEEEEKKPCSQKGMKLSILRSWIRKWPLLPEDERTDVGRVCIYNAFVLWIIGSVFFPNSSNSVLLGWFDLLDTPESIQSFDWGTNILGRIYSSLDMLCREDGSGSFNGMWMILEMHILNKNQDGIQEHPSRKIEEKLNDETEFMIFPFNLEEVHWVLLVLDVLTWE